MSEQPTNDQIDAEIARRIAMLHRLADSGGSKMSKMKMRAQATALSELLGWMRGKKRRLVALVLMVNGQEWDRARVKPHHYTIDSARRQMIEWREKVRREEPDAQIEVVESYSADDD